MGNLRDKFEDLNLPSKLFVCLVVLGIIAGVFFGIKGCKKESTPGKKQETTAKTYKVGDEVTFANQKWYVIKESAKEQNYVTLFSAKSVVTKAFDTRGNVSIYDNSEIKNYLETVYISKIGQKNLATNIPDSQIRLITLDEVLDLGCDYFKKSCTDAPKWITSENNNVEVTGYWTMTESFSGNPSVFFDWTVLYTKALGETNNVSEIFGIRPVINVLKSSL